MHEPHAIILIDISKLFAHLQCFSDSIARRCRCQEFEKTSCVPYLAYTQGTHGVRRTVWGSRQLLRIIFRYSKPCPTLCEVYNKMYHACQRSQPCC